MRKAFFPFLTIFCISMAVASYVLPSFLAGSTLEFAIIADICMVFSCIVFTTAEG